MRTRWASQSAGHNNCGGQPYLAFTRKTGTYITPLLNPSHIISIRIHHSLDDCVQL